MRPLVVVLFVIIAVVATFVPLNYYFTLHPNIVLQTQQSKLDVKVSPTVHNWKKSSCSFNFISTTGKYVYYINFPVGNGPTKYIKLQFHLHELVETT